MEFMVHLPDASSVVMLVGYWEMNFGIQITKSKSDAQALQFITEYIKKRHDRKFSDQLLYVLFVYIILYRFTYIKNIRMKRISIHIAAACRTYILSTLSLPPLATL